MITAENVPEAYSEMLWFMHLNAQTEQSRNGPVLTCPAPVELSIRRPNERVLYDHTRDANPFFHVMEFVWMMSGSKELAWINQFNKGFAKYSDDGKTLPASYGHRWRQHWDFDQISMVISHLRSDPTSRRAVLGMWDPSQDLKENATVGADRPCNSAINLRIVNGRLDFTVFNRSNDAIWGMLGANVVHMTFLQELIAAALAIPMGVYRVYTTNLHIYKQDKFLEMMANRDMGDDPYSRRTVHPYPLLWGESFREFLMDAEDFILERPVSTRWFREVATPVRDAYLVRHKRHDNIARIAATDWALACREWAARREIHD